jgi:hypothetical protein
MTHSTANTTVQPLRRSARLRSQQSYVMVGNVYSKNNVINKCINPSLSLQQVVMKVQIVNMLLYPAVHQKVKMNTYKTNVLQCKQHHDDVNQQLV